MTKYRENRLLATRSYLLSIPSVLQLVIMQGTEQFSKQHAAAPVRAFRTSPYRKRECGQPGYSSALALRCAFTGGKHAGRSFAEVGLARPEG